MHATGPPAISQLLAKWHDGDRSQGSGSLALRRPASGSTSVPTQGTSRPYAPNYSFDARDLPAPGAAARSPVQNRQHFVAVCALLMRQILMRYERTRRAAKRGGGGLTVTLDDAGPAAKSRAFDLLTLDDALNGLAHLDPQLSQIVELWFFGGLSIEETAELELSATTVKRHWATTRVWLHRELSREVLA